MVQQRHQRGVVAHHADLVLGRFEAVGHRITGDRRQGESRGVGWEFVHVCIDDASRIAFSRILPDERKESATAFLGAAVAYYRSLGVEVARVMTDNGSCYRSKDFRDACRDLGLRHIRTRPTPEDQRQARPLHPDRAARMGCPHQLDRSQRFGVAGGPGRHPAHDQPVAVLHQRVPEIAEFRRLAAALSIEPRVRVGGAGVRRIRALLALEVLLAVPARTGRLVATILAPEALLARPGLDQRPVHREVLS